MSGVVRCRGGLGVNRPREIHDDRVRLLHQALQQGGTDGGSGRHRQLPPYANQQTRPHGLDLAPDGRHRTIVAHAGRRLP